MTPAKIRTEITALETKISQLQHDLVLANGAVQAFKYVLQEIEGALGPDGAPLSSPQADGDGGAVEVAQ